MILRNVWLGSLFIASLVGCSTTPGDAAYRSGHPEQAADLYMQGADQGDGTAALKLGLMISEGKVSIEKYGSQTKWYIRACELGSDAGCHNSGNAYEYGQGGVIKDYNKAREYYLVAADKGFMQSQYNLGSMYANQYFENDIEGLKWMVIAEKNATSCASAPLCKWVMEDPPGHRKKLMSRMNEKQITEAHQLADAWKPKK